MKDRVRALGWEAGTNLMRTRDEMGDRLNRQLARRGRLPDPTGRHPARRASASSSGSTRSSPTSPGGSCRSRSPAGGGWSCSWCRSGSATWPPTSWIPSGAAAGAPRSSGGLVVSGWKRTGWAEDDSPRHRQGGRHQEPGPLRPRERPETDDLTLLDRVEKRGLPGPGDPQGRHQRDGRRGQGDLSWRGRREGRSARSRRQSQRSPCVKDVENLLHTPGTPAPNKASARVAGIDNGGAPAASRVEPAGIGAARMVGGPPPYSDPPMDDPALSFDRVAASLRADSRDLAIFLEVLAAKLTDALPSAVSIEHEGGLLSRKRVKRLQVQLGEHRSSSSEPGLAWRGGAPMRFGASPSRPRCWRSRNGSPPSPSS